MIMSPTLVWESTLVVLTIFNLVAAARALIAASEAKAHAEFANDCRGHAIGAADRLLMLKYKAEGSLCMECERAIEKASPP